MGFLKRYLIAVCVWEVCVIGFILVFAPLMSSHVWSKDDLVPIAGLAICGLVVVGCVALLSRPFGKIGGAIAGFICGLSPSALILASVSLERPGFEASAAGAAVAVMLAGPSGVGGAVAGIICSGGRKHP